MRINPETDEDEMKNFPEEIQLRYKLATLVVIVATFGFLFKILFL